MLCFLVRLLCCLRSSSGYLEGGLDDDSEDDEDDSERDILGRADKARKDRETENLHRAVARTITSVRFSERARESPEDQILLMYAGRAQEAMTRSLAAVQYRVPGLLPVKHVKNRPAKPLRLSKAARLII